MIKRLNTCGFDNIPIRSKLNNYQKMLIIWKYRLRYISNHLYVGFFACVFHFFLTRNLTVGTVCFYDLQCTGKKLSGLCSSGVCTCQKGYILIGNNCYPGKIQVRFPGSVWYFFHILIENIIETNKKQHVMNDYCSQIVLCV